MISYLLATSYLLLGTLELNPAEMQNLIQQGLEFAYIEEFDSAGGYFDNVIELYPTNPAGYFFKAGLLQLKMMDECHFNHEKEYFLLIKQVISLSERILEKQKDPWPEFYLASSYAYRAIYEALKGDYLKTFTYGMKAGRMLQNLIKKDSTFYDAYLGCGSFEYFWARASRYLPILKLVGGDANEAIRKLHVAAEKGLYSGPTAVNALAFIYREEGKYEIATRLIDSLLSEYPGSKTFLWNKAELEFRKKNHQLAIALYQDLYLRYDSAHNKNYSNLAQCKLYLGKCFYELKDKELAREALKEVISFKKYSNKYPKIKGYCREAYILLSRLLAGD